MKLNYNTLLLSIIPITVHSIVLPPININPLALCPADDVSIWNAIIFEKIKLFKGESTPVYIDTDGPAIVNNNFVTFRYNTNHSSGSFNCHLKHNSHLTKAINASELQNLPFDSIHTDDRKSKDIECPHEKVLAEPDDESALKIKYNVKVVSASYSIKRPTHILFRNGSISQLSSSSDFNYYFNFSPCKRNSCNLYENSLHLSDPEILFSNHIGRNIQWPTDKPIIFNIPIIYGNEYDFNVDYNFIKGLISCSVIWNFYAVDRNGQIASKDKTFIINRTNNNVVGGTFFAVQATIRDGPYGGFAGQVIAKNYEWLNSTQGPKIHDFSYLREKCSKACWPRKLPMKSQFP